MCPILHVAIYTLPKFISIDSNLLDAYCSDEQTRKDLLKLLAANLRNDSY